MKEKSKKLDSKKYLQPLLCVLIGFIIFRFVFPIVLTDGPSMFPTIYKDPILINCFVSEYSQGDIIVAKADNGDYLCKRVIGIPGDTVLVSTEDDSIYVNGEKSEYSYSENAIPEEIIELTEYDSSYFNSEIVLGEDEYFIMGDNRAQSTDSRLFGPIKKDSIVGKVAFILKIGK